MRLTMLLALALGATPAAAAAEGTPDSIATTLPVVEVTALRGTERIEDIPAATFVVSRRDLQQAGGARISTLLQFLPGLYGYRQRGSGEVEVVDPRGFTASGESSYLKLLVNGQDASGLENGDVDWDWLLPEDVERVEVVQGPGAWAYGDASEGGIVNVVRPDAAEHFQAQGTLRAGSFGLRNLGLSGSGTGSDGTTSLRGSSREVDGWRVHSRERVYGAGGEGTVGVGGLETGAELSYLDADREDPGTLTADQLAADREQAENLHDFRHAKHGLLGVHLQGRPGRDPGWRVSGRIRGEDADELRTLFLQPLQHHTRGWTGGGEAEWRGRVSLAGRPTLLQADAQGDQSKLESSYAGFDPDAGVGDDVARGQSWRTSMAFSAGARIELAPGTLARLSLRGDLARLHSEDEFADTTTATRSLTALSPLLAFSRSIGSGSVYASTGTAFRVPTLYQLYDRRPFVVAPDTTVSLSNPELDPQRSTSVEAGGRWVDPAGWSAAVSIYSTWVRDEIDFDLATLSYANISKSWHRGVEAQVASPLADDVSVHASGAWTPTTFSGGPYDGRQINGVPIATGRVALVWAPVPVASAELGARLVGRQWLDKLEEHALPAVAVWDASVEGRHGRVHAALRVLNLFNLKYSDTGFIGGFGEERFSPAAPRSVTMSLGVE